VEIVLKPGEDGRTDPRVEIRQVPARTPNARSTDTPVDIRVKDNAPVQTQTNEQQSAPIRKPNSNAPLPPPGTQVRLEPLSPYQARKINVSAQSLAETLSAKLPVLKIENAAALAGAQAKAAQNALSAQLSGILEPLPQTLQPALSSFQSGGETLNTLFNPLSSGALAAPLSLWESASLSAPITASASGGDNAAQMPSANPARWHSLNAVIGQAEIGSFALTPAASTEGAASPLFQTGHMSANAQFQSIKSSSDIAALITGKSSADTLTATVIGHTQSNQPIISIPALGNAQSAPLFLMNTVAGQAPPNGSQILLTPLDGSQSAASVQSASTAGNAAMTAMPPAVPALPAFMNAPQPWPLMEEIVQTLNNAGGQQAAQAMLNVTPSPATPAQMGPAALLFLAAVRGGDLTQWLSDKAQDILRRSSKGNDLLQRLRSEGQNIARTDRAASEWRSASLPLYWEGEIHKLALHYKQEQRDDEEESQNGDKQTRFVFDMNLSSMGPVQLDGLLRGRRLDLIVRTENPFSAPMQTHMKDIYTKAMEETELSGKLSFHDAPEGWVTVQVKDEQSRTEA